MPTANKMQNDFHRSLDAFVNRCGTHRVYRAASLISPGLALEKQAESISLDYSKLESALPSPEAEGVHLTVPPFDGDHDHVQRMMSDITELRDSFVGAFVHGSLATADFGNYSDFDALVILTADVLKDPCRLTAIASRLIGLRRIMIEADPLQHHGWLVLTEADLPRYCDAYFPIELFRHSRSLIEANGQCLTIFPRDSSEESLSAFESLASSVIRRTRDLAPPRSMYDLKSLASQFMLLPALYLQARYGKGVYKKDSFEIAQRDFPIDTWSIMDEVSDIRRNWPAAAELPRLRALSRLPVLWHNYAVRRASPRVSARFRSILNPVFLRRMWSLAEAMRKRVHTNARRT